MKREEFGFGAIGVIIGGFVVGMFVTTAPDRCQGCEEKRCEAIVCEEPTLQEIETNPVAMAQFCTGLIPNK
jgi:hypothetical protein